MAEYIEREKVVELIKNYGKEAVSDGVTALDPVDDIVILTKSIELMPTYTINRGQWTEKPSRLGSNYRLFDCSVCGETFTFKPDYAFCPRCGACMKGCVDIG